MLDQACAHCPIFPTAASRRSLGRVSVPVWLVVLSDQLPIAGLVGHYPTNYLIGRRPLPRRLSALPLRAHAVLAPVSQGYPPPQDTFLRVTHPSATDGRSHPSDLHVLSMPPAFALSQDQTLRFIRSTHQSAPTANQQANPQNTKPKSNPNHSCTSIQPPSQTPAPGSQTRTNTSTTHAALSADHASIPNPDTMAHHHSTRHNHPEPTSIQAARSQH